ncbi:TonB-dependent receptor [Marinigracilibium pacificum]|uniref:TonB-dependent receptor n=1 Tax=Marinigracilibium pacificum TaxID=2729599 RepID=A0A848IXV9_9BACT|nr:TonB-dependent receptor [Marinigracilibium pacificum]NMM48008.1 TonB-dependent receptor [Marinigracilibium pacificum]
MQKILTRSLGMIVLFLFTIVSAHAQDKTTITGKVTDASGDALYGVNVVVKGKVIGTITQADGSYNLTVNSAPPFTLIYSMVGFDSQEREVTQNNQSFDIQLEEQSLVGSEVVVSASRVEETILESPVSIEKMDVLAVQNTSSDDYYKAIGNLKGVDMTTSSVNFQIINTRGFNSTGNVRFVQLIDGMDTQAPALNFPVGSLNGPSVLDVESVELLPGAASALYGPNAFNGILLINSKNPFDYQGLSAFAKVGVNHIGGDTDLNSFGNEIGPGGAQPMYEAAIRYAKAFNNRFAFKVTASFSKAEDWWGTDLRDNTPQFKPTGFTPYSGGELGNQEDLNTLYPFFFENPGADLIHAFGDEVQISLPLVGLSSTFQSILASNGLSDYAGDIPNQTVSRTPYLEKDLVDYGAENLKLGASLNYRLTDDLELSYQFNYGAGTTVYTGAQRYSLANFNIQQHRIQLESDNFYLRGYTTIEQSGDSYIADLTGVIINDRWKNNSQWFAEYTVGYLGYLAANGIAPGASTVQQQQMAHFAGRQFADNGRTIAGSDTFEFEADLAKSQSIPAGSKFDDATKMYMAEGMYDFTNDLNGALNLQAGFQYRLYDLESNGTIFADTTGNDITIQEVGAFVQAGKKIFNEKVKLTGSLRWDKNENFNSQLNPRISAVWTFADNNNFRASFQTGFRNPTTQGQHIDLNVVSARLLGGLPQYAEARNIYENAYTLNSVDNYISEITNAIGENPELGGAVIARPDLLDLLEPADFEPVKPEEIKAFEFGYKGILGKSVYIDVAYYYNIYNNFIVQRLLRKAAGEIDFDATTITEQNIRNAQTLLSPNTTPGEENTFQTYTNVDREITAQGLALGVDYMFNRGYTLSANYNWNKLSEDLGEEFVEGFNTPENKFNVSFSNRKVTDKFGFNVTYRWQDAFMWNSSFANQEVPAVGTVDAQLSYKLKSMKSTLKLGGSNLLNERYVMNAGGPSLGAIYYLSITFDELMN